MKNYNIEFINKIDNIPKDKLHKILSKRIKRMYIYEWLLSLFDFKINDVEEHFYNHKLDVLVSIKNFNIIDNKKYSLIHICYYDNVSLERYLIVNSINFLKTLYIIATINSDSKSIEGLKKLILDSTNLHLMFKDKLLFKTIYVTYRELILELIL